MHIHQNKRFFLAGLILSLIVHCGLLLIFALSAFTSHGRFSVAPTPQQNKPLFFPTLVALLPQGSPQGSITPPPPVIAMPDKPQAKEAPPLGSHNASEVSATPHAAEQAALMASAQNSTNEVAQAVPSVSVTDSTEKKSPQIATPSLHESVDATPPSLETLATEYEVVDQPLPTAYAVKEITTEKKEYKPHKKSPPAKANKADKQKPDSAKKAKRKVTAEELKQLALASLLKEKSQTSPSDAHATAVQQDNERASFFSLAKKDLHQAITAARSDQHGSFGDPNGIMDIHKSLKYYSYAKRIDSEHDAAVRMEVTKLSRAQRMSMHPHGSAGIHLVINKEGYVDSLTIADSSGCPLFDRLIERAIMNGQPYSPIPDHLGIERYQPTGTRFITLN